MVPYFTVMLDPPFQSRNPYSGVVSAHFAPISKTDLHAQLKLAGLAYTHWAHEAVATRASLFPHLAQLLRQESETLAQLATAEMGKHIREARAEVEKCAALCDFYAQEGAGYLADEAIKGVTNTAGQPARALTAYQPLGVVFAIMPWNFPFWQVFRAAVPALLAGNGMLLKHAANVPRCALAMEDMFIRAGFPEHVFSTIFLPAGRTEEVLAHPTIAGLTLTGSEAAGRSAGSLAAKHLKKQVLELGGADPFIVLADADVDATAQRAAAARMINTGQSCIAAKRFIVDRTIAAPFAEAMAAALAAYTFGDPIDEAVNFGPLARPDLAQNLQAQVDASLALGATAYLSGGRPKGNGNQSTFFYPTLLTNIRPGMPAYNQELFGPVATLLVADNDAHALALANDHTLGLGASIWTADTSRALSLARSLEAGSVFINDIMHSDQRLAFGGIKNSGYGRELSAFGIREFVNVKSLVY